MKLRKTVLIWLTLLFVVASIKLEAQDTTALSKNSEEFFRQISNILLNTPSKTYQQQSRETLDRFYPVWSAGRFNKQEKAAIRSVVETMRRMKLRTYPYLSKYIYSLTLLAESNQVPKSIIGWHLYSKKLLELKNQKKFLNFLDFTNSLLEDKNLYHTRSVAWKFDHAKYRFVVDTSLLVAFDQLTLICASRKDSSTITETQGIYNYDYKLWKGHGGTVTWTRYGKDYEDEIYVVLQDYSIRIEKTAYTADSAVLYYKRFFPNPVLGRFSERVMSSPPNSRSSYPRFESYLFDFDLKNIYPGVNYIGGFYLNGLKLFGTGGDDHNAVIELYRNNKLEGRLRSDLFLISDKKLTSQKSQVVFYLENDSLYHPGLSVRFNADDRKLELFNMEAGKGIIPFFDSYHQLDIYAPALTWNLDSLKMDFNSMKGVSKISLASFISSNYFSQREFYQIQGIDEINPMYVIQKYLESYNEREIQLNALAAFMKKSPDQVSAMLINLSDKGFLIYNSREGKAVVKDRFFDFLAAKAGNADYDVIRLTSRAPAKKPNATLNLNTLQLDVFYVPEVFVSDSQEVYIYPYDQKVSFRKNRDFTFDGRVNMGLFDFYARNSTFEYDSFMINMSYIDTMAFRVYSVDSLDRIDTVIKVKNIITDLNGKIYIDMPFNKSGLKKFEEYPKFVTDEPGYVYYNSPDIQDSTLYPEIFYYKIEPFELDSILTFSTQGMKFEGTLTSAGIFPPINEPLVVLPDYSLGFNHKTPPDGYPIYGGKGTFTNIIHLGNQGFTGSGKLDYLVSSSYSDRFIFYPDSLVTDSGYRFKNLESPREYDFPYVYGDSVQIKWHVDSNRMIVNMPARDSFDIYTAARLTGALIMTPEELGGKGSFYFEKSEIKSNDFNLKYSELTADSADFFLRKDYDTLVFRSKGYFAKIDFASQRGEFQHLYDKSYVEFPYNKYRSTLDEVTWEMDQDKIYLRSNLSGNYKSLDTLNDLQLIDYRLSGPEFVSIEDDPDSVVRFFAGEASYDLNSFTIDVDSVRLIKVGDAAIFPNNGYLKILRDGGIYTLHNAVIIADTLNKYHRIYDAEIDIISRHWYYAKGYADYVDRLGTAQPVYFYRIQVNNRGTTVGYAEIEKNEVFFLSPEYYYAGEINLEADKKFYNFFGGFRLNEDCVGGEDNWVSFVRYLDPDNIYFEIDEHTLDMNQQPAKFGLAFSRERENFYPLILQSTESPGDETLINATGVIRYDTDRMAFTVGQQLPEGVQIGDSNFVELSTKRCILDGYGTFNMGLDYKMFKLKTAGEFSHLVVPDSTYLRTAMLMDFYFDEIALNTIIDSMRLVNSYKNMSGEGYMPILITQMMGIEKSQRLVVEMSLYGQMKRMPDVMKSTFLFSDVRLKWDSQSRSFVSQGPIGINQIAGVPVNKYFSGYMQIKKSRTSPSVTFYLQLNNEQWYFFSFQNGIMQVLSSDNALNDYIAELKPNKRILNENSVEDYYEFVISTRRKVIDFLREMETIEKRIR
ncbi:MAG: hypothetical protein GXO86_06165 [Chlorobi bacterium]|nr:hypothetical protein [Chlorobiota bacterium]